MKQALADALSEKGYSTLTPVQLAVTEEHLTGLDMLVSAQTGSGKTLGFGLAIAPTIFGPDEILPPPADPLALVIAPTRELAMQVKRELSWLYAKAGAVLASCVGGMDMRDERRVLQRGAHIVVATPGRLRDHILRGSIDLTALRAVVLDEADEMLDLGFREDLEFILGAAPADRQTLMFSATVPATIATLAKSYQREAVRITTKSEASQHADIEYRAFQVAEQDIDNAIINTLRFYEAPNAIVFCNTRDRVGRLTTRLSNRGFSVVALSGELSQTDRTHALQAMRDGRARVCVATDVAARGIDLPNLDLVVHAELPTNHETLLHRSGRTGRAGRKGVSTLIVPPKARRKAERILEGGKLRATWSGAPSADDVRARDEQRLLEDPAWSEPAAEGDEALLAKLVGTFTPSQLAAGYLRLLQAKHSAPEELSDPTTKPPPRAEFGPSTWFSLAGGRAANADPKRILAMLCRKGGLTRDDIGAIRIQDAETYIQVLSRSADTLTKEVGPKMEMEGAALKKLAKPPEGYGEKRPRPTYEAKPGPAVAAFGAVASATPEAPRPAETPAAAKPHRKGPPRSEERPARKPWGEGPARPKRERTEPAGSDKPRWRPEAAERPAPPEAPTGDETAKPERKPRHKQSGKPKGPPPPPGKPNSKKNKARAKLNTRAGRKAAKGFKPT